jgi:hypothetical protein
VECYEGYEIPTLNEGDPDVADDSFYEIANAGQLYYLKNEILQKKASAVTVRAKLTANIVVNAGLLSADGVLSDAYYDEDGAVTAHTWFFPSPVHNVVIDGDGYAISGLYGVRDGNVAAGLFCSAENVTIKNLGITDSIFSSGYHYVGVFFGETVGNCVLENCYALNNAVTGPKSAGLVGKLAYSGEVNAVKNCYTDAPRAIFECAAGNTVTACYYLAASESDVIEGTTAISALNTETLRTALSTDELAWVMSCLRNAPVLRAEHYYKNPCDADCVNYGACGHSRAEGEEGRIEHKFDNKCDAECNVCKNIRTLEKQDHYYTNVCDTDCNECGATRTAPEDHKYTNNCDEYCNYCQFKRVPPVVGHEYSNECDPICNWCSHKREDVVHDYEVKCEIKVCKRCATTTPGGIPHAFDNACDTDCANCGMTRKTEHQYGEFATVKEPTREAEGLQERVCSLCGAKETKPIEKLSAFGGLWLIAIGGAVLLAVIAIVVIVLLRKKKGGDKTPKEKKVEEPQADAASEETEENKE